MPNFWRASIILLNIDGESRHNLLSRLAPGDNWSADNGITLSLLTQQGPSVSWNEVSPSITLLGVFDVN